MILFDSHSHLDDKCYGKDLGEVLDRAEKQGVKGIAVVGIDVKTSQKAIDIADRHKNIVSSVGIHPHNAKKCSYKTIETLTDLARANECVKAWGETGLDFNRMFSPARAQENCFSAQLEAAAKLDIPLIFHERDSRGRFYEIIKADSPKDLKGVVHCFSGTRKEMFKYLDLGYYIGITGIVTIRKRGEYLRKIGTSIPDDRILIETDAPYLTPAPQKNRTKRNEPAFVKSVLLKLAEIKNAEPERLSRTIFDNTQKFYNVSF